MPLENNGSAKQCLSIPIPTRSLPPHPQTLFNAAPFSLSHFCRRVLSVQREMWAALVVLYDALVGPLELGAKTQFWTLLQAGTLFSSVHRHFGTDMCHSTFPSLFIDTDVHVPCLSISLLYVDRPSPARVSGLCSPCDLSRKRALHVLERYLAPHAPTPPQASAKGGKAKQPTLTPQEQEAKATVRDSVSWKGGEGRWGWNLLCA
jgi:hypothetical protein